MPMPKTTNRNLGRSGLAFGLLTLAALWPLPGLADDSAAPGIRVSAAVQEAQAKRHDFDIPAQPLTDALALFGRQSGLQVSVDAALVRGIAVPKLSGSLTPEQALKRLLVGTGITWRFTDDATVMLSKAGDVPGALTLDPITIEGKAESAYGPVTGYKASRSATATKTDTPIIDIPASVQVVPREVIEDQNATRLYDALRNVSGVQSGGTQGNTSEAFILRGFQTTRHAKDGQLAAGSFGDVGLLDLANIERVEVLKGPASILYGQNEPGGLINLVTKKPQSQPFDHLDATFGSYDFYRGEIDSNHPLTEDGSVQFRVNGAYQNSGSYRDFFMDSERKIVAPSVRWHISEDTLLDLQMEYYDQEHQFDRGLVAVGGIAGALPRDRFLGEEFSKQEASEGRVQATLDHKINTMWSSRTTLRFADSSARRFSADPQSLQNDNQTLTRRVSDLNTDIKNYAVQTNLTAKLKTGFIGHELLFGFDGNVTRFNSDFRQATLASINIFNPVYGATPGTFSANAPQKRAIDFYGLQVQDLISFGEHWKLLLGGRLDHATTQFERNGQLVNDATDKEISPRVGVVFQPVKDLSFYASYVESFDPFVFQINNNGDPYKPEFGEQIEVGVKRDWLQGRLSTTLSMFQLTRQNVLTADPNDSNSSIQTGEQRSRGIELDVSGEILSGWKIFGSFTYMDSEITKDNTFQVGNNLQNVPVLSGSLWSDYTIQGGPLRGLKLGGGVFVVGRREGDLNNSFEAPGYARVDARVSYKIHENLNASLNINNLFDKYYIEAPIGSTQLYPGEPLTILGKLQLTF